MAPPFLFTKVKITIRKVERVDRIGKTTFQEVICGICLTRFCFRNFMDVEICIFHLTTMPGTGTTNDENNPLDLFSYKFSCWGGTLKR